jgi:IS30 family transposase
MKQRTRIYYSDAQKALTWERWKQGWTLHQIAQLFNRAHTSVQGILARTGGIRPPPRARASTALTLAEREEISRAMAEGHSIRSIASRLGRAASTVSRELSRNGGRASYRATNADSAAWTRALRPKRCKLVKNRVLAGVVTELLRMLWSPEQIAGWLQHTYPNDASLHVSHETIYRSLFIQARGALKKELLEHLRHTRGMRRSRSYTQKTAIHGQIADAVSISERPASAEDRAVPGHWEGDLVFGGANSQIATLVERQTRYLMLVKLEGKDSQTVVNALIKNARRLPQELYKSLTWDRGTEMHAHKRFTMATDIQVYFCDPQSPWQRGSNENTNGLLRQYMPKGVDISGYSQLQEPDQPCLIDPVEEAPDIGIENPVHPGTANCHCQCVQCVVSPLSGPEPVREAKEVFLVDRIEDGDNGALDDFVFQRSNTKWPLLAISLRNEPTLDWLRPVRAAMNPVVQALEVSLQCRLVVLPHHTIHSGCGIALECHERIPQRIKRDVVQQRGELLLLPLPRSVPYTVQPL